MGGKTSGLVSTGLLPPNHHLASYTDGSYAMYALDQARAQGLLADAGWVKGSDGFVTHASDGRHFKPAIWSTTESSTLILADFWKQVGLDASVYEDFSGGLTGSGVYGSYFRNGHLWDRSN